MVWICGVQVDPKNTLTLQEFREAQEAQKQIVMDKLQDLSQGLALSLFLLFIYFFAVLSVSFIRDTESLRCTLLGNVPS